MGLTLIAILTGALLLPGIVAARAFYHASRTSEVEPAIPPLSSTDGVALVGVFSVVVHLIYVIALSVVNLLPAMVPLPLADPYRLLTGQAAATSGLATAQSLFFGLLWLCITALPTGFLAGKLVMRYFDRSIFYGALADVIDAGRGDHRFITAYVLSKVRHERRAIGYQGTVVSIARDADRLPAKIVLKEAAIFYLDFDGDKPVRREQPDPIDWITLSSADWENVAFQVFEVVEEAPSPPPSRAPSWWPLLGLALHLSRRRGADDASAARPAR